MSWFKRERSAAAEHDDPGPPVEIDLGLVKAWEVELLIGKLQSEGRTVQFYGQSEVFKSSALAPQRGHVLVTPADEPAVRAELAAAGFL